MCAYDRRPNGIIKIEGELSHDECMEDCFLRGAPSWSYRAEFGKDNARRPQHHSINDGLTTSHASGTVTAHDAEAAIAAHNNGVPSLLPSCLCANPSVLLGFVDDPDYNTYSLAGINRMPENYIDAGIINADSADFQFDCKITCLKMNSSLWYAVWNNYGKTNYAEEPGSRCRCSDPEPGDDRLSSKLVEDPGYDTRSLAGPHTGLRPLHKLDAFDLDDDECLRHCSVVAPGSTWAAIWNPVGEITGEFAAGMTTLNRRCLCEDTSKEYAIDIDPEYDLYSLRGEC